MERKRELLFSVGIKDCELQTFCGSGPGGQHKNRKKTAVRIIHHPSGAVGEAQEHREQLSNKREAFKRMASSVKFRVWVQRETERLLGQLSPEEIVDRQMHPQNIKVEVRGDNGWMEYPDGKEKEGDKP